MYRVESGVAPLRTPDITALADLYQVPQQMRDLMVVLGREGREGAWWYTYGEALPSWFEWYVGMEAYAMRLRQYDAGLIPGLLQTADYAEEVLRAIPSFTAEEVAAKVALRGRHPDPTGASRSARQPGTVSRAHTGRRSAGGSDPTVLRHAVR